MTVKQLEKMLATLALICAITNIYWAWTTIEAQKNLMPKTECSQTRKN